MEALESTDIQECQVCLLSNLMSLDSKISHFSRSFSLFRMLLDITGIDVG